MSRQFGRALDTFVPLREGDEGITAVRMVVVNSDYTSVRLSFAFFRDFECNGDFSTVILLDSRSADANQFTTKILERVVFFPFGHLQTSLFSPSQYTNASRIRPRSLSRKG
jgi:hypothetical protein